MTIENEQQIDEWTMKHNIPKAGVQELEKIWNFSKKWFGNHLNPNWTKWSIEEAKKIFREFGLTDQIWELENSNERF